MRLLSPENTCIDPSQISSAVKVGVLDFTDPEQADYFFPDVFVFNEFTYPGACLQIGNEYLEIPLNFRVLSVDVNDGRLELVTVDEMIQFEHHLVMLNPICSKRPEIRPVKVLNIYQSPRSWFVPRVNRQNYVAVPVGEQPDFPWFGVRRDVKVQAPLCVFLADDQERMNDHYDLSCIL